MLYTAWSLWSCSFVSNSIEQVLRLRRCEARVMTIGFTLFYALKNELSVVLMSSFSSLMPDGSLRQLKNDIDMTTEQFKKNSKVTLCLG